MRPGIASRGSRPGALCFARPNWRLTNGSLFTLPSADANVISALRRTGLCFIVCHACSSSVKVSDDPRAAQDQEDNPSTNQSSMIHRLTPSIRTCMEVHVLGKAKKMQNMGDSWRPTNVDLRREQHAGRMSTVNQRITFHTDECGGTRRQVQTLVLIRLTFECENRPKTSGLASGERCG